MPFFWVQINGSLIRTLGSEGRMKDVIRRAQYRKWVVPFPSEKTLPPTDICENEMVSL